MYGSAVDPLPFTRGDLRRAIPDACFRPSTTRSIGYLLRDVTVLVALYVIAVRIQSPWILPVLWFAQGTMAWALFAVGHDCGHGSFSRHRWLNDIVGHMTHTPLLVPYHGWRLSHRIHHRHAGDIDKDETWFPLTPAEFRALPWYVRILRFRLFVLALPFYLLRRTPGRRGSHFNPHSDLFPAAERGRVAISAALCGTMAAALATITAVLGPGALVRYYLGPYTVFAAWLGVVTYLHHTDSDLPWYRRPAWNFLRGALSTKDRHYGPFERIHHDAGTHVVHHLFPGIPHYRLRVATAAVRPVLGPEHRVADIPIRRALWQAARQCLVVPERGECVYYKPIPIGDGSRAATKWYACVRLVERK